MKSGPCAGCRGQLFEITSQSALVFSRTRSVQPENREVRPTGAPATDRPGPPSARESVQDDFPPAASDSLPAANDAPLPANGSPPARNDFPQSVNGSVPRERDSPPPVNGSAPRETGPPLAANGSPPAASGFPPAVNCRPATDPAPPPVRARRWSRAAPGKACNVLVMCFASAPRLRPCKTFLASVLIFAIFLP